MVVNGFQLPAAFVQLCEAICDGEEGPFWEQIRRFDAYGSPWWADLTINSDEETIRENTEFLTRAFEKDGFQQANVHSDEPGFIFDFTDVSRLVWFGRTGSGEPFCFDFRGNHEEPSVIHWTDAYWRRVAPNFVSFIALFVPADEAEPYDRAEEQCEYVPPSPPEVFRAQALAYVQSNPANRPIFEGVAGWYFQCTAEQRRDTEEGIRQELDSRGMSDKQERTLQHLMTRLHASASRCQRGDAERSQATLTRRSPFDLLAADYQNGTEEDRRELEAGLWILAESRGMSEDERRGVEELVERLRSSVTS